MLTSVLFIVAGYLLGSVSTAIVVCWLLRLPDPRSQGSGNPGATNVLRIGGKKAAIVTLLGDMVKGLLPVVAARFAGLSPTVLALVALAAFFGHLFPVFFGFRGGKGVATAFGTLLGLQPLAALAALATWLAMALVFRISSLAALTTSVLTPLYLWGLGSPVAYVLSFALVAVLLLWRHRANIKRLVAGTESRIGHKNA